MARSQQDADQDETELGEEARAGAGGEVVATVVGVRPGLGGVAEHRDAGVVDKVPSKIDIVAPASPRRGRGFEVLGSVAARSGNGAESGSGHGFYSATL